MGRYEHRLWGIQRIEDFVVGDRTVLVVQKDSNNIVDKYNKCGTPYTRVEGYIVGHNPLAEDRKRLQEINKLSLEAQKK